MNALALVGALLLAGGPVHTLDDCVRVALSDAGSAKIAVARAKVAQLEARLAQVESVFYPKLSGMAFIAPIFTVRGSALEPDVERDYALKAWGPYTHLEATLAQPLYTFGRVAAGERAAAARAAVERARVREVKHAVVLEVRRLYFTHLMAMSLLPTIENVSEIVGSATERAQAEYAEKTGEVTKADLMRLELAHTRVERARREATDGASLALAALKHTMGLSMDATLQLDTARLPRVPERDGLVLATLMRRAAEQRPEWAQLKHGERATIALKRAEQLAMAPVLFLAGRIDVDWAPTRDDTKNPYHLDEYNDVSGGAALGLKFDLDVANSLAKADEAAALTREVEALRRFAATGIPLQVRKAWDEVQRARELATLSGRGVKATRKWVTFSVLAYETGTEDARDLLEGVAAWVGAKRSYYEAVRAYFVARAELDWAVGDGP